MKLEKGTIVLTENNRSMIEQIRSDLEQVIDQKLRIAGIYHRMFSRVKSETSLIKKLSRDKYGFEEEGKKKLQDLIGIRINLYYYDDLVICRNLLEDTFHNVSWSTTNHNESKFEAQKINGVIKIPGRYQYRFPDEITKDFPIDMTFEVQLRTLIFEGWHEVEHDMRYKYKTEDDVNKMWEGNEMLARVMNSVLADLELCDWSIVQVFDKLSESQLNERKWGYALLSRYRFQIAQEKISNEIAAYFNDHVDIAMQFYNIDRATIVNDLLIENSTKTITPDYLISVINKHEIHDETIASYTNFIKKNYYASRNTYPKMQRLKPLPVFYQKVYITPGSFERVSDILYDWMYDHMIEVFPSLKHNLSEHEMNIKMQEIGYSLDLHYVPEKKFKLDMQHIGYRTVGTIWHSLVDMREDEEGLCLIAQTLCESVDEFDVDYTRPSYLETIYDEVGYLDAGMTVGGQNVSPAIIDAKKVAEIALDPTRKMALIIAVANEEGQFSILLDKMQKATKGIAQVYGVKLGRESIAEGGQESNVEEISGRESIVEGLSSQELSGGVLYWKRGQNSEPAIYTEKDIRQSYFDENRKAKSEDGESYEPAFRHILREIVQRQFKAPDFS